MFKALSLRAYFYALLLLALTPAAAFLIFSVVGGLRSGLAGTEERLERRARILGLQQEDILQGTHALMRGVASVPGATDPSLAAAREALGAFFRSGGPWENAFISDRQGRVFAAAKNFRPGVNISGSRIFSAAWDALSPSSAPLYRDPFTGGPALPVAQVIADESGAPAALLVLSLNPAFAAFDSGAEAPEQGFRVMALDMEGGLLWRYPQQEAAVPEAGELMQTLRAVSLPGGAPFIHLHLSLPSDPAGAMLLRSLVLLLASLFLAIVCVWLLDYFGFLRSVGRLARAVKRPSARLLSRREASFGLTGDVGDLLDANEAMYDSLEKRSLELINARNEAFAANRAKSEFLTNMSNGIRAPINAVISLAYLMLKRELSPKLKGYMDKIYDAANSLQGIINDILDFSRIENGQFNLENTSFFITELLENSIGILRPKAEEKKVRLDFRLAPDMPELMLGDPLRLGQLLANLVSNAIKFTEEGGSVEVNCSMLKKARHKAMIRLVVKDSGIGMSEEQQARLFQPFTQVDGSATRKFGGTGLGLIISKRLVEFMDGSINVSSALGSGTSVEVRLALRLPREERREFSRKTLEFIGFPVLLIDDSREAGHILEAQFKDVGLVVDRVRTPQEGFTRIAKRDRLGAQYRLVCVELHMARLDGPEIARRIHSDHVLKRSPPVIITSNARFSREDEERCKAAGAAALVRKPFPRARLAESIGELFRLYAPTLPLPRECVEADTAEEDIFSAPAAPAAPVVDKADTAADNLSAESDSMTQQAASAAQEALPPLPELNPEALKRLGGNQKLYRKLLVQFVEFYKDMGATYKKAVESEDLVEVTRIAHTLKGLAGSIGADGLFEAAKALEFAHKEGGLSQPELAEACFSRLLQVQEMLSLALGLGAGAPPASAPQPVQASEEDKAGAGRLLEKLVAYLRDDDGEAAAFFEANRKALALLLDPASMAKLQNSLAHFEFGEALAILGKE